MVAAGADVPKNQIPLVTDYLTKSYPEGNVPKAVIIPGRLKVSYVSPSRSWRRVESCLSETRS